MGPQYGPLGLFGGIPGTLMEHVDAGYIVGALGPQGSGLEPRTLSPKQNPPRGLGFRV